MVTTKGVTKGHHPLYKELAEIVGADYVRDDDTTLWSYSKDSSVYHVKTKPQGIVVRPGSTEDVVEIVKLANRTLTPIVPRGGACSLGGLVPGVPGRAIVLDMTRMNRIIKIDEGNKVVVVEAGINECEMIQILNERGWDSFHSGVQPYYTTTIGGHVSGPSAGAGLHLSRGWNWKSIVGLKIVLPNGDVIETNRWNIYQDEGQPFRWVPAPDLTGFFQGTYGAFGVATEATIRIYKLAPLRDGGIIFFDTFDNVYKVLYELADVDPHPAELIFCPVPSTSRIMMFPEKWGFIYALEGRNEEELNYKRNFIHQACLKEGGKLGTESQNATGVGLLKTFWKDMGTASTFGMWVLLETILGREEFPGFWREHTEWREKFIRENGMEGKVMSIEFFFPIDETFVIANELFYDDNDPEMREKMLRMSETWMGWILHKGRISFEAACGWVMSKILPKYFTPEYRDILLTLKRAMDPNNIMNPGVLGLP